MKIKTMLFLAPVLIVVVAGLFGAYWVAKHGSYWLWYDGMVRQTVREMVKPEYLR
jgi:hypothetical protein